MPCSRWYFFIAGIVGQKCIFTQFRRQKVTHRAGPSSSSYGLQPEPAMAHLDSGHGHPQVSQTGIVHKRSQRELQRYAKLKGRLKARDTCATTQPNRNSK